jgi:alpha-tubulin suppressor-like RCC1 family protein
VLSLDLGDLHTCGLFDDNLMRCWGAGNAGQLGNAMTSNLGDVATLGGLAAIMLGGTPTQFASGGAHNCARFGDGGLRCWGDNVSGQLGTGDTDRVGDTEIVSEGALVDLGPDAIELVATGYRHSCAVTSVDDLFCWGLNNEGQLGHSDNAPIGDDGPPNALGPVNVHPMLVPGDSTIIQLALGREDTCVLFSTGEVLCWGRGNRGQLGQGDNQDWSDSADEPPSALPPISLGGVATAITAGGEFNCALMENGDVRCWGLNDKGQLGLGTTANIGDNELPNTVDPIDLGGAAISISSGIAHTCAVLEDYSVVCWGTGNAGRLGYGDVADIGDDETPASVGAVQLF